MAEDTVVQPTEAPAQPEAQVIPPQTPTPYITKVYSALKDNLAGFNKTPEQFAESMKDSGYAAKAYSALKDNLSGFNKTEDDFYSQVGLKKKDTSQVLPNGVDLSGRGLNPFQNSQANTDLTPVLPQNRDEVRQQQAQQTQQLSDKLNSIRNGLDDEHKKGFDQAIQAASTRPVDQIRQPSDRELAHDDFMQTPIGKALGAVQYLGSKATKGTLQIARGAAHLAQVVGDPTHMGNPAVDANINTAFDKADENTNFGLSKGDVSRIEDGNSMGSHVLAAAGMAAEFAPTIAAGGETNLPKTFLYLQGLGQGSETADKLQKQGVNLNPVAKELLVQGTGVVNMALEKIGDNIFGKMPASVRGNVVNGIVADALKESAGKDLTQASYKELLDNGIKTFADKFEKAPVDAISHYNETAKTLTKLNVGNYLVHKAVDAANDKTVFNETLGNLAEQENKTLTQDAPTFAAIPAIGEMTKLLPNSSYKNDVVENIVNNPSPENVDATKQALYNHGFADDNPNKWTPQEMDATFKHVDKIAEVAKTIPQSLDADKKAKAMDLILGRNDLTEQLKAEQDKRKALDPSIQDVISPKEQFITDKIEQANDKIKSLVTGKRTTYSKGIADDEGKFFKTTEGKQEDITPDRYNLERTERDAKAQKDEQATPNTEIPAEQSADETGSPSEVAKPTDETVENNEKKPNEEIATPKAEETSPVAETTAEPTPAESADGSTDGAKPEEATRQKAIDAITHGIIGDGERKAKDPSPRFDLGMNTADQKRAIRDITKGNYETAPAKAMLSKVMEFDKNGEYPIIEGEGGSAVRNRSASSEEIQQHIDDAKQFKLAKEQNVEENNKGLKDLGITHQDIQDYENYRSAGEPGTEAGDGRATTNVAEDVQRPENDTHASTPQDTGSETVQSEPDSNAPAKEQPAEAKPARQPSLSDAEAKRKLELRKKFSGQLNDVTRIPTLLADKEFREYAGLVFKEAAGDFKAFSKELIDNVGEKIKEHLPALFKDLGGKDEPSDEPIGITKEETRKQREMRGLENLPDSEKTTLSDMFDSGREAVDSNVVDPTKLAAEVAENPRNLSPVEVNALLYDRQRIRLSIADIHSQIDAKLSDPDHIQETVETLQNRQRYLEEALDTNERALRVGANQNALALVAMRNMINADYTHATQQARMRSLAGGKLTPEMEKELDRYSKELDEANKKLADYEKQFSELQSKKIYDKEKVAQRKAGKAQTKESLKAERKNIVNDFLKELEKIRKSGTAMSDIPYRRELAAAAPFIKRMLTNLAKEGITEFKDVISTIHENFAEHIDGLQPRDIMDVLAGKYNERKETKNELLEKKNNIIKLSRLITRLEDLQNGIEKEKSERRLVQKRKDIADLEAQIKEVQKQLGPTDLERTKESLKNRLDKLNERIKNGDFQKPEPKQSVDLDPEAITLKAKVNKAKNNFDAMADRLSGHNKTKFEKVADTYTQIRRAMLLSGVKTLGKLYSFAALRSVNTPIEEVVNSVNTKIPGLRKIAEKSPRFARGLSLKAESLAITTRWSKATLKDSWVDVLQTGAGELDRLYGKHGVDKDFDLNPSALEFFGRLHGALKNSTKRAEFFRSFQKRLEWAQSNAGGNQDINDPNVQFVLAEQAFLDGKRSILMNDNLLVDKGYKGLLRGLDNAGEEKVAGKALSTAIRGLFPIVKIPTNYVLETYDAITGATPFSRALPNIYKAIKNGADSLSPKEADMIMRTLAKGQVGLAAMIYAYNNPQHFGGYYSGKRKDNDLKAGDIFIIGHKLPHFMSHNPVFEAMQIAATMRRAIDEANGNGAPAGIMETMTTKHRNDIIASAQALEDKHNPNTQLVEVQDGKKYYNVYIKKGDVSSITTEGGVKEGIKNSVKGLAEQIPFTSAGDLISSDKTTGNIAGEAARNQVEPRLLQEAAEFTDKDKNGETVKRDPKGFTDQMKMGIPGLREQVDEKTNPASKKISTIKLEDGTEYKLNDKQIAEREQLNAEYIKEHGDKIRARMDKKDLTEHDIDLKIQKAANKYSKAIIYHKYKEQLKEVDE